ncbi:glutamate-1-semialdehyde-2,1-aminomutase [Vulcanibacillus modesticaldus]|uniref:Glutamate-1-semialdehyde 2,1-aminomutase n=1 Tax=Vulcanibacillus modesticaldus TaxID=337097 RepID=A0A1D2YSW6_9BACI|nr:glutamate-1-semialdehyde 2,1-aminomutase [Vulcanibacillus modesticaldus]OEF98069.1 glutamate-1-semialdehyde-2,1-aminomutase [Vulcanibacillus modesticaldus]
MNRYAKSIEKFTEAKEIIPGGVNSPVRAFKSVDRNPVYIDHGIGSKIYDIDGNEYIDYVASWGPLIVGHAHPEVISFVRQTLSKGTGFGTPTELETEMAKLIIEMVPSIEMVRMVNSGTEATMSAIRLARGYTGKSKIIKFEGNYHGHSDSLLIKAGSGVATLGLPDSPGVPEGIAVNTITVPYNDIESVRFAFEKYGEDIAAIIVEPVAGNMGVVPPKPGFLQDLREITDKYEALLIFDEVMTGFRVGPNSAQGLYGVTPDITTLGKIIGGGLPVGAYGGKKEIMAQIAPVGSVYQAGTLSGNPVAMAAGIATLKLLKQPGVYEELARKAKMLAEGLAKNALDLAIPYHINSVGSMVGFFYTGVEVIDYETAKTSDLERFKRVHGYLLDHGIYIAPSQFEALFISTAHTDADINKTIEIHYQALKELVK